MTSRARLLARRARARTTHVASAAARSGRAWLERIAYPPGSDRALRRELRADGARIPPLALRPVWHDWVNRALRRQADVDVAVAEVHRIGLPAHGETTKNWDLLVALGTILDRVPPSGAVLDMGAPLYSRLLPWLFLHGYRRLTGIDLTYTAAVRRGPIRYEPMDLTATSFAAASFDAIACLSVIEHGVDIAAYVAECARLLRPGGVVITSTDFWCSAVDTGGQMAYGVPIRILGAADLERLVALAATHGLRPVRPLDLACEERVVTWRRFDLHYTFAVVVLERMAGPEPASSA
jgi:SAM-dependent methyltransferase